MKKLLYVVLAWLAAFSVAFAAVDINTAGEAELDKLPGIGPVKAKAIVEDRQKNGPFKSADDLKRVKGIGDKTFDKLKGEISVGGAAAKPAAKSAAAAPAQPAAAPAKAPAAATAPAAAKPAAAAAPSGTGAAAAGAKPADAKSDRKAKAKEAKAKDAKDDKKKSDKHGKDAKADDGGNKK